MGQSWLVDTLDLAGVLTTQWESPSYFSTSTTKNYEMRSHFQVPCRHSQLKQHPSCVFSAGP